MISLMTMAVVHMNTIDMRSELNIFIVFSFAKLVRPGISLQELLHGLLDSHTRVKRSFDGLSGERISSSVFLHMFFNCESLVTLTTVCHDGVLHQVKSYSTLQVLGDGEDYLLVACRDKLLHFLLLLFVCELFVFLEVVLR